MSGNDFPGYGNTKYSSLSRFGGEGNFSPGSIVVGRKCYIHTSNMGLDVVIPLLVFAVCLLPNLLMIWAAAKLRVSRRLGNLVPILIALSLVAAYLSYLLEIGDLLIWSLSAAIAGAIMALVAIDYFLTKREPIIKVIGVLFYFLVLVFCETVIIGIVGHM